jgi:hypothetical protein
MTLGPLKVTFDFESLVTLGGVGLCFLFWTLRESLAWTCGWAPFPHYEYLHI